MEDMCSRWRPDCVKLDVVDAGTWRCYGCAVAAEGEAEVVSTAAGRDCDCTCYVFPCCRTECVCVCGISELVEQDGVRV